MNRGYGRGMPIEQATQHRGGRILVVDDDAALRGVLSDFLTAQGLDVCTAANARAMSKVLDASEEVEVLILDIMMPGESGLSICRRLSGRKGPAILLHSALAEVADRVVGLEMGADAYLPKPCTPRELLAQVRALMRRQRRSGASRVADHASYSFLGRRLDPVERSLLTPEKVVVPLSNKEFMLLKCLLDHPQEVVSRDMLSEALYGHPYQNGRAVDVHVSRLRRRLGEPSQAMIQTLHREGYMFIPPVLRA